MKKKLSPGNVIVYHTGSGEISLRPDYKQETIWAAQAQIAEIFAIDRSVVTKHINNLFKSGEVDQKRNVQKVHIANSDKPVRLYSLDLILAVGYRTNSARAIEFRKWATKTLKAYIVDGYAINKKRIAENYVDFLEAVESVRKLLPTNNQVKAADALELIKLFANTWFSLRAYDQSALPKAGFTAKQVKVTAQELEKVITELKQDLIEKKQASELFAQERQNDAIAGIVANVFQSVFGQDAYETLEEKAAHLLYFFTKNHPFVDGNKRSAAFAFVWFLNKANILQRDKMSPEALTALTLLVAESAPKDKERVIGLVLQLIKK